MLSTVKDIVLKDYKTADVFKKWGINYCCGGNHSLDEVCSIQKLDKAKVEADIEVAVKRINISNSLNFSNWPINFLIDYITYIHHDYLKINLPALLQTINLFVDGHRKKYNYLDDVKEAFENLCDELLAHNKKEEEEIFPYLKQISNIHLRQESYGSLFVRTLSRPLAQIEKEHKRIDNLLEQLKKVTNNYTFQQNACTNHQVIYHKLKELDEDLAQHKYLENKILFPKVISIEKELLNL